MLWKEADEPEQHLRSGMLFMFDDGIGGCADGAKKLLSTIVEDDDTPGKLLYYYPPNVAVEKIYFLLGFVIQASRILADLQGSSAHNSQGLLAAKRRLAYAGSLHWRLGSMCTEFGAVGRRLLVPLARRVAETELEVEVDDVTVRERQAAEERSRLEMHPCASITLDHARLSVIYDQGITWVLTTDLGLPDNSLADHLRATTQRFWSVAKGSRPRLLSSCDYRRDGYKAAVTAAASLTAPFAMAQLSSNFRCCRPMAYVDGANWTAPVTLLTASQLLDVAQRQQHSIGCCVVSASIGDIRCIASTMDTTTTQLALSISCSCVEQRSAAPGGSQHWAFSCPVSVDQQTSDALLLNLPPIQRLSTRKQLPKAGLCMKVTSHVNELLVAHVMHVGTNATDEGWSQPSLATEYGEDFVVVQSLLQSLQQLVQAAKASSVLSAEGDTGAELRDAALGAARYSPVTGAMSHQRGERLANESLTTAFPPACEAFRQPSGHQRCNQMIFGTSHGVTLCRSTFGMWSAFTKTARHESRASLSLENLGADLEGHAANTLGI